MTGIFIHDWRNAKAEGKQGAGVAVAFQEGENHCSCYNVGDVSSPFEWDVTIAQDQHDLSYDETWKLKEELARSVPHLLALKNIIE